MCDIKKKNVTSIKWGSKEQQSQPIERGLWLGGDGVFGAVYGGIYLNNFI